MPLSKAEGLREAKQWLRALPRAECERLLAQRQTDLRGAPVQIDKQLVRPGEQAGPPYADPYYWAAFILLGDPQ
jgi:CHAT domain-containing protein